MHFDDQSREALEIALNESDVLGLRLVSSGAAVDVLLHVLALPENGSLDADARRILRLLGPNHIRVLLRPDSVDPQGYGPVMALPDLDAVESFFASLLWGGSMYGWKFFDDPNIIADWPSTPSLSLTVGTGSDSTVFYWFNECGRAAGDGATAFFALKEP